MKALRSIAVITLIFLAAVISIAQEKQDTRAIREKIEQVEQIDLKSKSASVQDIYKKSLLRLYRQYSAALTQDIADLKLLQSTLSVNDSSSQKEISAQLQQLEREQSVNTEKLRTLAGELQSIAEVPAPTDSAGAAQVAAIPQPTNAALTRLASTTPPAPDNTGSVNLASIRSTDSLSANQGGGAATDNAKVLVCGQIRPASLTQTFALIRSVSRGLEATRALAETEAVKNSRYRDECTPNPSRIENLKNPATRSALITAGFVDTDTRQKLLDDPNKGIALYNGSQKEAVVLLLQTLLNEMEANKKTLRPGSQFSSLSQDTIKKQILLLNEYIGNVRVTIKNGDGNLVATPLTDKDGNYLINLAPGKYYISTEADGGQTIREIVVGDSAVRVNIPIEDRPVSLLTRAVVGYEQSGAAAAKREQNYFFDLFISSTFPFRQKINPDFGERFRTWVDLRFDSVPQPGTATLGEFSTGFATQVSGLKVKDVANVFEFLGGIEYRLTGNNALLPSFDRQTKQKFSISFIAAGGVTTPTNPQESITTFRVLPGAPGLPPIAVGKDFIAFVQSDRDRFFRQYYVGLRLQTFFFNLFNVPMQRFPGQLDLTIGQNEFVTGGKLAGPVIRIEGYYPLPYEQLKFINIFGTAMLRPGRATIGTPLILQPAPDGTVVPAANVAIFALPQPNRDYYRAGVGIDFISFVQKMKEAMSNK